MEMILERLMFTCIGKGHGAPCFPANREDWEKLRREPWLKEMCERIERGDEQLKHRLPVWTPHCAEFRNNHRAIADAVRPLNRLMLDFDEKGHTDEICARLLEQSPLVPLLIEESVRRGTHVLVELPDGMTAEQAQQLMREATGFEPDAAELKKVLDPSVKAVIINNPNNPTGAIYSRESLEAVADVLREAEKEFGHPIYIISDEPYRELVYVDKKVEFLPDIYDDTIIAYSWSKSLSMPGARIGYAAVPRKASGSEELREALVASCRVLGANNASTLAEIIVERSLKSTIDLSFYYRNAKDLYRIVTEAGFEAILPQGAFYLWFKSPVENEMEFIEAAKEEGLLLVPGRSFCSPGWVRASFCGSHKMILRSEEAFKKVGKKYFG